MKNPKVSPSVPISKFILFTLLTLSIQGGLSGQELFPAASVTEKPGYNLIQFSVKREVNIFQYRVEVSEDSLEFEVAGTIKPKGNSLVALDYSYALYESGHLYYRISAVHMGGSGIEYSKPFNSRAKLQQTEPAPLPRRLFPSRVIALRKRNKSSE